MVEFGGALQVGLDLSRSMVVMRKLLTEVGGDIMPGPFGPLLNPDYSLAVFTERQG